MLAHRLQLCWTEQFRMIWEITESWPKGVCVYNTYNHMHAKACQVSCSLITHSSGTPRHYGNPSILFGQNCVRKKKKTKVHTLPLPCNTMENLWVDTNRRIYSIQSNISLRTTQLRAIQNIIPFCFAHYKTHSISILGQFVLGQRLHWVIICSCWSVQCGVGLKLSESQVNKSVTTSSPETRREVEPFNIDAK